MLIPFQRRNQFEALCPKINESRLVLIETRTTRIERIDQMGLKGITNGGMM